MEESPVCIVGGGPVGCFTASILARKKIDVVLFEQQQAAGLPVQCAGLVTPRVIELLPFSKKKVIQTALTGANIHSPDGEVFSIGGNKTHAYSIDRKVFDQCLMKEAEKNGATINLNQRIVSIQKQSNAIELTTSKKHSIQTSLLIGADGPYSKIRDVCNLPQPKEFLRGFGAYVTGTALESDTVELFIGNSVAPGFFAWMIPITTDGTKAKIGLCITTNAQHPPIYYFKKLFSNPVSAPYLKKASIQTKIAGIIPLGALKQTVDDNLMLVGDAAAQVKPTSGGGLYPGLLCAKHCAKTAEKAVKNRQYHQSFLEQYHDSWTKDLGRELKMGMQFRKIYTKIHDDQFNAYIRKFKEKEIEQVVTDHGDMDYPSKLAKPVLKKIPSLLKFIPAMLTHH